MRKKMACIRKIPLSLYFLADVVTDAFINLNFPYYLTVNDLLVFHYLKAFIKATAFIKNITGYKPTLIAGAKSIYIKPVNQQLAFRNQCGDFYKRFVNLSLSGERTLH